MTEREIELWFEGQVEKAERMQDLLAWLQANMINIHIPRGKPRLTMEKIRGRRAVPAGADQRSDDEVKDQVDEMAERFIRDPEERDRARDRRLARRALREQDAKFWASPEGVKLAEQQASFDS